MDVNFILNKSSFNYTKQNRAFVLSRKYCRSAGTRRGGNPATS